MEPIIHTEHLTFSYPAEEGKEAPPVLRGVSLDIPAGQFLAVLGHNGSGKSTLAKHLNSILLPMGGKAYVDGIDTCDEERVYDIRQRIGMVFQNPDNQIVATVVEEDVAFGLENLGLPPAEIRRRVDESLKAVDMFSYREHAPHRLSGGQKQRVEKGVRHHHCPHHPLHGRGRPGRPGGGDGRRPRFAGRHPL